MTAHKDLKHIIRDRQAKTGESYTAARAHVMRERASRLGLPPEPPPSLAPEPIFQAGPVRLDAAILKVDSRSARVRILGEPGQITFRSTDVWAVVPGHVVTLLIEKRWTWRGDAYASGRIENPRIDLPKLGLEPLLLHDEHFFDLRLAYEPVRAPDPYAPLWRRLTAKPRLSYEMDGIAWGAFPDSDACPTADASEMIDAGDVDEAYDLLMDTLLRDLRCIDAHVHLGVIAFDRSPDRAMIHYEMGIKLGEMSLPPKFDGVLVWGHLYNRPFLRALKGYALCLWRLGETAKADKVFRRILSLNPNDNQGVRFCREDIQQGLTWEQAQGRDEAPAPAAAH